MHFLLKVVSIFWLKVLFSEAPRRTPALDSELIALDASERGGSAPVCGVHRAGWGWLTSRAALPVIGQGPALKLGVRGGGTHKAFYLVWGIKCHKRCPSSPQRVYLYLFSK